MESTLWVQAAYKNWVLFLMWHSFVKIGFLSIRRYRDIDRGCGNSAIIAAVRYRMISLYIPRTMHSSDN